MKVKNRACELNVTFSGITNPVERNQEGKIDTVLNEPSRGMLFAHNYLS